MNLEQLLEELNEDFTGGRSLRTSTVTFPKGDDESRSREEPSMGRMPKPDDKKLDEGFDTDESLVRELVIYIENDGELYRRRTMPIMKNLARKMRKGNYDPSKAVKLWMYLVNDGAKKYAQEFDPSGAKWHEMFPKAIRLLAAQELAEQFQDEVKEGEHNLDKLAMREHHVMEVDKKALKEMVRESIRKQLNEAAGSQEWDMLETIRMHMDDTQILEELMRAMSTRDAVENLQHIMDSWDLNEDTY